MTPSWWGGPPGPRGTPPSRCRTRRQGPPRGRGAGEDDRPRRLRRRRLAESSGYPLVLYWQVALRCPLIFVAQANRPRGPARRTISYDGCSSQGQPVTCAKRGRVQSRHERQLYQLRQGRSPARRSDCQGAGGAWLVRVVGPRHPGRQEYRIRHRGGDRQSTVRCSALVGNIGPARLGER